MPEITANTALPGSPPIPPAHEHPRGLAHQFDDLRQQKEAATLGMWTFLATEVMFFGGVMLAYAVYRGKYAEAFAIGSRLEVWWIGFINTGVLLCSSLTMAIAVYNANRGLGSKTARYLVMTVLLGIVFMGIKGYEYAHIYNEHLLPGNSFDQPSPDATAGQIADFEHKFPDSLRNGGRIFFSFYFIMTGIHATHMIVGIPIILLIAWKAKKGTYTTRYYDPVENIGLYWHFVDIVWIFLYPLLYLIDLSSHTGMH